MGVPVSTSQYQSVSGEIKQEIFQITQAYNIDHNFIDVERRGYHDAEDPRNLFAAMYGGVYKRNGLPSDVLSPEELQYLKNFVVKRAPRRMNFRGWSGLKDPYDPRNLFHSI